MSIAASVILFIGRILFVALFLYSARGHIVNRDRYVTTARGKIPLPYVAGWPIGAWLSVAFISMVLGLWPDIGALILAAFLIPTALLFHNFWSFSDPAQRRTQQGPSSVASACLARRSRSSPCSPSPGRGNSRSPAPYSTCADFGLALTASRN
jgi:putative oxidoreductase